MPLAYIIRYLNTTDIHIQPFAYKRITFLTDLPDLPPVMVIGSYRTEHQGALIWLGQKRFPSIATHGRGGAGGGLRSREMRGCPFNSINLSCSS